MSAQALLPPIWTESELKAARDISESRSVLERRGAGPNAFYEMCRKIDSEIRAALLETDYFSGLDGNSFKRNPLLWQVLRYFCAPPISEEDLWTVVGRKFARVPQDSADRVAETFISLFDRLRVPWLDAERAPTDDELESAIAGTLVLLAHERLKTERRKASSRSQEEAVSDALTSAGWTLDSSRKAIVDPDILPRGSFSRERKLDGAKCDVPVRLGDGRLLGLECKVSNGPKNSWKRLGREVGGKAERWKEEFGSRVVTAAVLSGVYDLKCLLTAQNEQRVYVFWEHDLRPLVDFLNAAQ